MPTAQVPRGAGTEIFVKEQSDFKTAATGNYQTTAAYSWPVQEEQPDEDDPLLGATKNNTRDAIEPAPGSPTLSGQPVVPLDFSLIGIWLKALLGSPETTGDDGDYEHVFESGQVVLPELTVERKMARASGSIFLQHRGIMVDQMTLQASRQAGYARATLSVVGYGEFGLSASAAGTPAALPTRDPIAAALGIYKIDTVSAALLECSLTYANNLQPREEIGDARLAGFDIGDASLTGSIRLRIRDRTIYDAAADGTLHAGEMLWQKSATRSLSWAMPKVKLQKTGLPNEGPGFIDQTFNLRCHQDASAPMLTATLKSAIAAF